ncbi:protein-L-isoaspartate O-methyltransferase [Paractinoplanes rishiriensis]|uniref:Protein-L-isoaspartate O-methyltransferase n=1 Tax=Paractinoplanes rishiriensis TaxID=1050105 RepID=A0A919JQA7_9ACTN|nr:protein-L-isoaspartate O-methyltransferase [Actinoplanes rishiriensis]
MSLSPELAAAFGTVRREAFVPDGFQRRDGTWATPADPDFLATVYRDDVLVTKVDGRVPVSSSSQPSLMAIMIEALRVRPGQRILEIGAGTGYNAALLASLGATITSIDVQQDVADRARSALARAGIAGVRVEHSDGYAGRPGERFDRIIVTVGIAGLSPHWLSQLEPAGLVIAPVDHAGTHPVLAVHGTPTGPVTAAVVCPSGFMTAAGPLTADYPGAHPPPAAAGDLTDFTPTGPPRFDPPLEPIAYRDLWYAAGAWSRRATHAAASRRDREQSCLALLDEPLTGGALILPDGSVLTAGPEADAYATEAATILDRWLAAGRPPMQAWRVGLALTGDPQSPIWVPATWELPR